MPLLHYIISINFCGESCIAEAKIINLHNLILY